MMKTEIAMLDRISLPSVRDQRAAILEMEAEMLKQEKVEAPATHLIHGGMYARAVTVVAGTLLTGHIYKFDHMEIMVSGVICVTTDDGQSRVLEGFNLMPALTGKKRAAYVIEDTTWMTVHAIGDLDADGSMTGDEVQEQITSPSFEDLDKFYAQVNNADYAYFVESIGLTEEQMQEIAQNESDQTTIDLDKFGMELRDSAIHGKGLFVTAPILEGEFLAPAKIDNKRTQAGRYTNHAIRPNAKFIKQGDDWFAVAIKQIDIDEEITVNYRDVTLSRQQEGEL